MHEGWCTASGGPRALVQCTAERRLVIVIVRELIGRSDRSNPSEVDRSRAAHRRPWSAQVHQQLSCWLTTNMGGAQSTPKITARDRAILEYVSHSIILYAVLKRSVRILKSQNPARQAQTVSEEGRH